MLACEGYKMFYGTATITPRNAILPFDETGTWLYKPDTECWYVNGRSFPESMVKNIREDVW